MKNHIYLVTQHFTPYLHNGVTPRPIVNAFSSLSRAMEFVKGTDGNGTLLRNRVDIHLREGRKPMYDISTFAGEGIAFDVNPLCMELSDLDTGGFVDRVTIEKLEVY